MADDGSGILRIVPEDHIGVRNAHADQGSIAASSIATNFFIVVSSSIYTDSVLNHAHL